MVSVCAGVAAIVLVINIAAVIYLYSIKPDNKLHLDDYYVPQPALFMGSCSTANRLNTAVHLLINILSTVLLAASNFCMQLLIAPTRNQINRAHRKRQWLDIGIPSLRNFRHVSRTHQCAYLLLAISSLPLHLLYVYIFPLEGFVDDLLGTIPPYMTPSPHKRPAHSLSRPSFFSAGLSTEMRPTKRTNGEENKSWLVSSMEACVLERSK
jgi:hypothetical protein